MVYVDTSALVALIVPEACSSVVANWYAGSRAELVSARWCLTEFASALGIKQRTGQLDTTQAQQAWQRFERLVSNDLRLLAMQPASFHRAAQMTLEAGSTLRAGDALHLACAELAGAKSLATLDAAMAENARRLKIKPLVLA